MAVKGKQDVVNYLTRGKPQYFFEPCNLEETGNKFSFRALSVPSKTIMDDTT